MEKITLYKFESADIKISIEIYFNDEDKLILDGYDIGKRVRELMGDTDYEYQYTVEPEEAKKIANILGVDRQDKMALLKEIKSRFSGNNAYSKFGAFMEKNDIKFDRFTWR